MTSTKTRRALVALATSTILLPTAPAFAQTAQDTAPPQILSVDFSPETVDVSNGPATVNVTVCATDATGVREIGAGFQGTLSAPARSSTPVSGTRQNGCFALPVVVPFFSSPASAAKLVIYGLFDTIGNGVAYQERNEALNITNGTPILQSQAVNLVLNGGATDGVATAGTPLTLTVTGTPNARVALIEYREDLADPQSSRRQAVQAVTLDAQGRGSVTYTPQAGGFTGLSVVQNVASGSGFAFPQNSNFLRVQVGSPPVTPTSPPITPPTTPPIVVQPTVQPQVTTTPTPLPTATPTPALTDLSVSAPVIDYGSTVDVTVRGTAGATVNLLLGNARLPQFRVIRTATIGASGTFTWTGLRPEDTSNFVARLAGTTSEASATVRVRRAVTIGIQQPTRGIYVFSGQLQRAEAGVQVTVARLDSETKRVTGVASTNTDAAGRYTIRTALPQGFAGYYALTEAENGLDAGRSRLYGLIVNTRPAAAAPAPTPAPATQSVSLDVGVSSGNTYIFSGRVTNGGSVPVTLARIVNGQLVGVAGGRTAANGGYVFRVPVAAGTHFFTVLTASARSRNYGLVVPAAPVAAPRPPVVTPPSGGGSVYYENCTAVRNAGAAPIRRGDPGYRAGLDGDGDGVACAGD